MKDKSKERSYNKKIVDQLLKGTYKYSYYFGKLTNKGEREIKKGLYEYLYHWSLIPDHLISSLFLPAVALPEVHSSNVKYTLLKKVEEVSGIKLIGGSDEVVWLGTHIERDSINCNYMKKAFTISASDLENDILDNFIEYCRIVDVWKEAMNVLKKNKSFLKWSVDLIRRFTKSKYNVNRSYTFYRVSKDKIIKKGYPISLSIRASAIITAPYIYHRDMERIDIKDIPQDQIVDGRICAKDRSNYRDGSDIEKFRKKRMNENLHKLQMILDGYIEIPNTTTIKQIIEKLFPLPNINGVKIEDPFNSIIYDSVKRKELELFLERNYK